MSLCIKYTRSELPSIFSPPLKIETNPASKQMKTQNSLSEKHYFKFTVANGSIFLKLLYI